MTKKPHFPSVRSMHRMPASVITKVYRRIYSSKVLAATTLLAVLMVLGGGISVYALHRGTGRTVGNSALPDSSKTRQGQAGAFGLTAPQGSDVPHDQSAGTADANNKPQSSSGGSPVAGSSDSPVTSVGQLLFTSKTVHITGNNTTGGTNIYIASGKKLYQPKVTGPSTVIPQYEEYSPGSAMTRQSWTVGAGLISPEKAGSATMTVTTRDEDGQQYAGTFTVTWDGGAYLGVVQGGVDKIDQGTTYLFVTHFTLAPTGNFGHPMIHMRLDASLGCRGGDYDKNIAYNGTNAQTLSCVLDKWSVDQGASFLDVTVQAADTFGGASLVYYAQ